MNNSVYTAYRDGLIIWDELDFNPVYASYTGAGISLVDMTPDTTLRHKRCYSRIAAKLELARTISEYEAV